MSDKKYLYSWQREDLEDLTNIEKECFRKADELNDKMLDAKILLDEITEDWYEYLDYLEEKKVSKICEFRGGECIDFNDELRHAIVETLRKSLTDTKRSINYNRKKIALNRVIDG